MAKCCAIMKTNRKKNLGFKLSTSRSTLGFKRNVLKPFGNPGTSELSAENKGSRTEHAHSVLSPSFAVGGLCYDLFEKEKISEKITPGSSHYFVKLILFAKFIKK
jgi:hypothetical protein